MMTSRERLRRCYFHEELDRPGVYCRTGYPRNDPSYEPLIKLLNEKTDLKAVWSSGQVIEPLPIETREEPHSDDFARIVQTIATPQGSLVCSRLRGLKNQPGMTEKHFIDTREEAEMFLSLPPRKIGGPVDGFFDQLKEIGDKGIVEVGLGMNPAGTVADLFGSENFAMMSVTDRDVVHAICEKVMNEKVALVDYIVGKGLGPFFAMLGEEYVVPPLHGPTDFFDFNVTYDKPILDRVHNARCCMHIHCHGPLKAVLDGFLEMGADVLHPIEPPPMGNVSAVDAKTLFRGKVCIEGNIQIADMYNKTADDIREQTWNLIQAAFDDHRGLIVCPTASPWIYGAGDRCIEQFRAMIDTVLECSR